MPLEPHTLVAMLITPTAASAAVAHAITVIASMLRYRPEADMKPVSGKVAPTSHISRPFWAANPVRGGSFGERQRTERSAAEEAANDDGHRKSLDQKTERRLEGGNP